MFFKKAGNEKLAIKTLESDATFAWVRTTPAGDKQFALQQSTYVNHAGENYLQISKPASVAIKCEATDCTGAVDVQGETTFKLKWKRQPVKSITLNDKAIPFSITGDYLVYSLRESGNFVIR